MSGADALFAGGPNIAMKVPPHQWDAMVAFYRDILGLAVIRTQEASVMFRFGANNLWIDRVPAVSQAELWLEIITPDTGKAADALDAHGIVRCDEIEPLPDGFDGFWIAAPAGIVHLVAKK